jgi:uncharacterized membrane protein YgcG
MAAPSESIRLLSVDPEVEAAVVGLEAVVEVEGRFFVCTIIVFTNTNDHIDMAVAVEVVEGKFTPTSHRYKHFPGHITDIVIDMAVAVREVAGTFKTLQFMLMFPKYNTDYCIRYSGGGGYQGGGGGGYSGGGGYQGGGGGYGGGEESNVPTSPHEAPLLTSR